MALVVAMVVVDVVWPAARTPALFVFLFVSIAYMQWAGRRLAATAWAERQGRADLEPVAPLVIRGRYLTRLLSTMALAVLVVVVEKRWPILVLPIFLGAVCFALLFFVAVRRRVVTTPESVPLPPSWLAVPPGEKLRPGLLAPRIRPWLGAVLWIGSNVTVMTFGQLVLPHALSASDRIGRDSVTRTVGVVVLAVLLMLHLLYWRRVIRHLRAERALRSEVVAQIERDRFGSRPSLSIAQTILSLVLITVGGALLMVTLIVLPVTIRAFGTARSTDSPMMALLYLGSAVVPFAVAMVAVGFSRFQLARV